MGTNTVWIDRSEAAGHKKRGGWPAVCRTEPPAPIGERRADALRALVAVVDRLRDPDGGCPWDLEQSIESMAPSLIEEAHDGVAAIEFLEQDQPDVILLDVLLPRLDGIETLRRLRK